MVVRLSNIRDILLSNLFELENDQRIETTTL